MCLAFDFQNDCTTSICFLSSYSLSYNAYENGGKKANVYKYEITLFYFQTLLVECIFCRMYSYIPRRKTLFKFNRVRIPAAVATPFRPVSQ